LFVWRTFLYQYGILQVITLQDYIAFYYIHSFKTRRNLLSTVQYGLVGGKITINGAEKYNSAHIDISGKEPIRITGLLFLALQSLSGLALERISEKNPEDEEKRGG